MSDNNSKDPIERLFQKKSEDYDISYNEADWLKLEKRLDIQDKQQAMQKRQRWIIAASILIISLLGYFTYENYTKINQISQQLNDEIIQEEEHNTASEEVPGKTDTSPDVSEESHTSIAKDHSPEGEKTPPLQASGDQTLHQPDSGLNEETDRAGEGNRRSTPFLETDRTGTELFVSELSCADCGFSEPVAGEESSPALSQAEPSEPGIVVSDLTDAANNNPPALVSAGNKIPRKGPRAAIGLVMAPDLSTVGSISNFYDPGYKIGVTVEYNLSQNLSIAAGVIQSEVRYLASGGEYKPPPGYWTDGIVPRETVGECLLIDIPVSLKYNVLRFDRSRLYATVGISSYIMQSEEYEFNYDREDTGLVQSWDGKTGTRHWMSNAGFSIGYELDIHSNWSLRAEPFVRVPLKEVGWGNVKLYSLGSFVSINYKL